MMQCQDLRPSTIILLWSTPHSLKHIEYRRRVMLRLALTSPVALDHVQAVVDMTQALYKTSSQPPQQSILMFRCEPLHIDHQNRVGDLCILTLIVTVLQFLEIL